MRAVLFVTTSRTRAGLNSCICQALTLSARCCCAALCVQLACHAGRLTVLLDLDGTLVSSFTPRRAPVLPPSMKTHLVGVGSSLNPAGVFVVERPGLTPFLQQLAAMSEVVVFTAGELQLLLWLFTAPAAGSSRNVLGIDKYDGLGVG